MNIVINTLIAAAKAIDPLSKAIKHFLGKEKNSIYSLMIFDIIYYCQSIKFTFFKVDLLLVLFLFIIFVLFEFIFSGEKRF